MALGDIQLYDESSFGYPGDDTFSVAAAATTINPGEPVAKALGAAVVTALATAKPIVGTDFMAGIASSTSTQTASVAGKVQVMKLLQGQTYLITPAVPASWNTQALYDALVGARIQFSLSAGVYTVNATDSATNGLVVEPLDIIRYPVKVRFSIRSAVSYRA